MNSVGWLFLYTPLPWLAAITVAAYRHDLPRFVKPFRDCHDLRAWWSVCKHLGLIDDGTPRPPRRVWRSKPLWALLTISTVSLIGPSILAPLGWYYYLIAFQTALALGLFLAVIVGQIGPIPYSPYADTLRYPRLGTRIRHLRKEGGSRRNPVDSAATKGGDSA